MSHTALQSGSRPPAAARGTLAVSVRCMPPRSPAPAMPPECYALPSEKSTVFCALSVLSLTCSPALQAVDTGRPLIELGLGTTASIGSTLIKCLHEIEVTMKYGYTLIPETLEPGVLLGLEARA